MTIDQVIDEIYRRTTDLAGVLVARSDGRSIASREHDQPDASAAIAASSLQLARRLGDLLGDGSLEEMGVHTTDGYVIVYRLGDRAVLAVFAKPVANLARINLVCRELRPNLITSLTH